MKILLGICGSIAAYKAPLLARELIKRGAQVRVVMTPSAAKFVQPLVLQNLTRHSVAVEMFDESTQNDGSWHIHLARWCDAMLIAPCSAATLGKIAHGISDTALTLVALALSPKTPLLVAPAMDTEMWIHPATQRNVEIVQRYNVTIIPPAEGELASGFQGVGRLPEIAVLADAVLVSFSQTPFQQESEQSLHGKTVLLTAGPTVERIDDVRFISNHSSGKMGYALAREAARRGAKVVLVSGPVTLAAPDGIERVSVESAQQMYEAVMARRGEADILILAAAVADFTPAAPHTGKIKKATLGTTMTLELTQTQDILASLGKLKQPHQTLIGFALEAAEHEENARKKLVAKNCDMIVLNAANTVDSGFGGDRNTITLLSAHGGTQVFPPMSKEECARKILDAATAGLYNLLA